MFLCRIQVCYQTSKMAERKTATGFHLNEMYIYYILQYLPLF